MKFKLIPLIAMVFFLINCKGRSKVDATSESTFGNSIKKIESELTQEEVKQFQESLQVLAFSSVDLGDIFSGKLNKNPVDTFKSLDGKTAKDIIKEADKVLAERKAREKEQALKEIEELKSKKINAENAKKELEKIKILKSRIYKKTGAYSFMNEVIIELELQNNTDQSLSRFYFKGTLASPGRKVPWLVDDFNYSIPGGLEPGESKKLSLAPNSFSGWGRVELKKDAVLTIEVVRVEDYSNKTLYSSEFSESDNERLGELQAKYTK